MFLQTASGTEIAIIFIFLIILGVGALIKGTMDENKQDDRIKKYGESNKKFLDTLPHIPIMINDLARQFPKCSKCGSINFQFWDFENQKLVIRCVDCKKKTKPLDISVTDIKDKKISLKDSVIRPYLEFVQGVLNSEEDKFGEYLRGFLYWDFQSLRAGQPLYRAITFQANPVIEPEEGKYDHIKNDEPSRRIPQKVMDKVWNRDGGKCVQCGSKEKLEFDHIIPFSKGGANTYRNIQLLCENCNRSKSDKIG